MAEYKVPGVYIEEPFGLSLSIQTGQTAVPVFAFDDTNNKTWAAICKTDQTPLIDPTQATAFSSWLEVSALRERIDSAAATTFEETVTKDLLYQSLKLYFLNGGGHCYVAPLSLLARLVPALDDATLLVQAGVDLEAFKLSITSLYGLGKTMFVLFDSPTNKTDKSKNELTTEAEVKAAQEKFEATPYGAVYYPWLTVPDVPVDVPPSGAVAGIYARVDRQRGVWKAPANVELVGATPKYKVSDEVDGFCNVPSSGKSINVIRAFRGTGPLVWGARTLASSLGTWRYVPVRRLFNAVERDIHRAMGMALFEPNSALTWERVRGAVESYMHGLWQQGALLGDTPAQAYFVQIGLGTTMTQTDINNGKMIVKVGLSAVRPAEFIVLQLTQDVVPA